MDTPMLEPDRRWYRNPDLIASSLLVVLGVLFFADVLFTSKNFYFRDILNFHYPLRKVLITLIDDRSCSPVPLCSERVLLERVDGYRTKRSAVCNHADRARRRQGSIYGALEIGLCGVKVRGTVGPHLTT
jgi:hypothetical protein